MAAAARQFEEAEVKRRCVELEMRMVKEQKAALAVPQYLQLYGCMIRCTFPCFMLIHTFFLFFSWI